MLNMRIRAADRSKRPERVRPRVGVASIPEEYATPSWSNRLALTILISNRSLFAAEREYRRDIAARVL
jgi:hypothetical protein